MKINPNDPAYPNPGVPGVYQDYPGIPIRLEIAARFAAARVTLNLIGLDGDATHPKFPETASGIAVMALSLADALIAAYNESEAA